MDFNHYFTNEELEAILPTWVQEYPDLLTLTHLGQSYEKRPLWLLTLTNKKTGSDIEKPALWIDGNIHATEIAGTTTALMLAYTLLVNYGKEERLTHLLDTSVLYIAPRINPDGAAWAMAPNPRYIRSGVRPYPFEEKQEGLHAEDLDKDGVILQMRIPDPNGDWKISSLDPRLMEKRSPNESGGAYYRLLPEGMIEDYDGYLIKLGRPQQGLDFNRNFPYEWRPEGDQNGAGPYPASEPEIKAVADFIVAHPNINLAVTYHTYSRVILRCSSTKPDSELDTEDLWVYKKIGQMGTQFTGYRCVSVFHDFLYHPKEITTGAFDDWMYDHRGVFAFTVELWDLPSEAGIQNRKFIEWYQDHPHHEDVQILQWADAHAGAGAYVAWYPFNHPQLGPVELGGWNSMYTWRNPPAAFIGSEAARNVPFAIALGELLPHLAIHTLEVTPLEEETGKTTPDLKLKTDFRINLVVENTGFLPTHTSQQAKKRQAVRPLRVELELPAGVSLINGKVRSELDHLAGRSNKLDVTMIWGAAPTDHRGRGEWVIRAPAGAQIGMKILSERAGTLYRTIQLGG